MSEFVTQPWPYAVLVFAIVFRRRLKFWGPGFGLELNHDAEPKPDAPRPAPRRQPRKGRKKRRGK